MPLFTINKNLEDGIEHTPGLPGFTFKNGVDVKAWKASELYSRILVDRILLDLNIPEDVLLRLR